MVAARKSEDKETEVIGLQCSASMKEGESCISSEAECPTILVMKGSCLPHRTDGQMSGN